MPKKIVLVFLCLFILFGCQQSNLHEKNIEVTVAEQFGLAYAPIEIMKANGFLEKALEEAGFDKIRVTYTKMGNTVAIREGMLSGDLDIGFVAIPPFLIAKDNGMDWQIISGVSESPIALITKDTSLSAFTDLGPNHRIILPQPGSIQHILLAMYADKHFGDARYFDQRLVSMSHPDGVTALLSGDSTLLHFTTPPFMQKLLSNEGYRILADGQECFGDAFTFIVGVCPNRVYENKALYLAFQTALDQAITFMNDAPDESLFILSQAYDYTYDELSAYLNHPQMVFTRDVKGLDTFMTFMHQQELIKNMYPLNELIWPAYEN